MKQNAILFMIVAALACGCGELWADETNTIFVLDENDNPVAAEICAVVGKTSERIGHTGTDGCFKAEITCKQGQRILVRPDDDAIYFQHKRTECPLQKVTRIKVSKKAVVNEWLLSALQAQDNGKYGMAAKYYDSLAVTANDYDESAALTFRKQSLESLGKQFNVPKPLKIKVIWADNTSNPSRKAEVVESDALSAKVKSFQVQCGLAPSGKLDEKTWTKIGAIQ